MPTFRGRHPAPPPVPGEGLLRLIDRCTVAFQQRVLARLIAAGFDDVTMPHFTVALHLRTRGGRATTTELAQDAGMTKQSMGYLVDHMEERGYVGRTPHPTDRRAHYIALTERGLAALAVGRLVVEQTLDALTEKYGDDCIDLVEDVLSAIADGDVEIAPEFVPEEREAMERRLRARLAPLPEYTRRTVHAH